MSHSMCTILRFILLLGILTRGIKCVDLSNKEWWETTLVYQIWPRGFQDSDGDGEGDLKGIISKLNYIKELGIETIWLNPIYGSPLVDSGFDVSNHTDINPLFGNFADFYRIIEEAHKRELKVMIDIIPNHSSNKHRWFLLSTQNIKPYNDYYIWANGSVDKKGNKMPPNNWVSTYNKEKEGSAWTWNDVRKQWYYHKFHEKQPDLNLRNENVIKELWDILKFWLEKHVDGFRFNSVPYFFEDKELRNEPFVGSGNHTFGLKESIELLYVFRAYINNWVEENNASSKLLIAESYDSVHNLIAYYGNDTHKGIPPTNTLFINPIHNKTDADYIKSVIDEWFHLLPENASTNWMLSNHDFSRVPSRIGLNRVDGLHMLSLLLPGQAYTYYGEEIAMLDSKIRWHETIDPMGCAQTEDTYENFSRDPARAPMQWNNEVSAGFSTNKSTYLPVNPEYVTRNVKYQEAQERSNLRTYKRLAKLRKDIVFTHGDYELKSTNNNNVLILKRSLQNHPVYIVIVNLWIHQEQINLASLYPDIDDNLEIVIYSSNSIYTTDTVPRSNIMLTANAALVLKGKETPQTTSTISTIPTISTISIPVSDITPSVNVTTKDPNSSEKPTEGPISTKRPTEAPDSTSSPTKNPSSSEKPTEGPTSTSNPTKNPNSSEKPTEGPTSTSNPTKNPNSSEKPTEDPTSTSNPTKNPNSSEKPTEDPTSTSNPTKNPNSSEKPTEDPTNTNTSTKDPNSSEISSTSKFILILSTSLIVILLSAF
ncbi:maltase A3-like isoform X2 [Vespa mandarinia]|uniref:maltase A3-like isoform X2 n=1 Tax=Vespa mandarinia TaxID=7446 RepID=UPI001618F022|nr:maltase A3-like isoform X2 [Vespa mandarinia]